MTTPDPAPNSEPQPATTVDAVLTDYADLGTAFGLDASVASATAGAAGAVEPAGPSDPASPAVPWEQRLARRRGL